MLYVIASQSHMIAKYLCRSHFNARFIRFSKVSDVCRGGHGITGARSNASGKVCRGWYNKTLSSTNSLVQTGLLSRIER